MSAGMLTAADIPSRDNGHAQPATRPPLRDILHDVTIFICKYVVVTDDQAVALALWVAHTHFIAAAECTPYLQITSATKRSGKTRLLEVLEPLVAKPWLTGRTSAAVLVRKTDAEHPTLLLDESDAAFKGEKEYAEALRGILNTGYRQSGKASLCVGQGASISYKDFSTFSPKAIAGIGDLPGTVADRSIRIALQRRRQDERCARWRERIGHAEAESLRAALVSWAHVGVLLKSLEEAEPALPCALGDRQADCWEPLLAIADVASEDWSRRARKTAVALSKEVEDSDKAVELLSDIAAILVDELSHKEVIATAALVAYLNGLTERPWATWKNGKPMTDRNLATLLKPLGIRSRQFNTDGVARGYRRDAFNDAISRYLPFEAVKRYSTNKNGAESQILSGNEEEAVTASKTPKTPVNIEALPHYHFKGGEEDDSCSENLWRKSDELFKKGWH